jgi:nitrite reductase (NADH) large subunit
MKKQESLVVIGNGMAGMRTVEELLKLAPDMYGITVFGAEPHGNYNRILLSPVLAGEKTVDDIMLHTREWYAATVSSCTPATRSCASTASAASCKRLRPGRALRPPADRDRFHPFIVPVPGHELPGVIGFRDLHDVDTMLAAARAGGRAVVIGGGLLGLEAANGLLRRGMEVTVVHVTAA